MPTDRTVTVRDGRVAVELGPPGPAPQVPAVAGTERRPMRAMEDIAMPESVPGFDEMPLYDMPAAPASIRQAASSRRLRARFLRAGRQAVDEHNLLELLLSGRPSVDDAGAFAASLLDTFGTAPRALAARPDRLRTVPGMPEDAVAVLKAAEALGIRMARAEVPQTVRPSFGSYDKVIEYCRTLAGHREVEEFHILYLNRKNVLITDECLQKGSVCHTPVYPREICVRALELQASAVVAVHDHPSGSPEPSRADIDMTNRIRDALKTIEVTLLDHVIVTQTGSVSFQARGLL